MPPRQTPAERCRSGRTGRSRKPLWVQAYPGFESLSLRQIPLIVFFASCWAICASGEEDGGLSACVYGLLLTRPTTTREPERLWLNVRQIKTTAEYHRLWIGAFFPAIVDNATACNLFCEVRRFDSRYADKVALGYAHPARDQSRLRPPCHRLSAPPGRRLGGSWCDMGRSRHGGWDKVPRNRSWIAHPADRRWHGARTADGSIRKGLQTAIRQVQTTSNGPLLMRRVRKMPASKHRDLQSHKGLHCGDGSKHPVDNFQTIHKISRCALNLGLLLHRPRNLP